jgi:hypothetical protein
MDDFTTSSASTVDRMGEGQRGPMTAWLVEAERVFAALSMVFEQIVDGEHVPTPEDARRFLRATRELEFQARQLRVHLTIQNGAA